MYGTSLILRSWAIYICMLLLELINNGSTTTWAKSSKKLTLRILFSNLRMYNPYSNRKKSLMSTIRLLRVKLPLRLVSPMDILVTR
jgi:hypothetical protein